MKSSRTSFFTPASPLKMRNRVVHVVRPSVALRSTRGSTISWLSSRKSNARYVASPGPVRWRVSTTSDGNCSSASTPADVRSAITAAAPSNPIGTGRSCSSRSSVPRGATSQPPAEQPAVRPGGSRIGLAEPSLKYRIWKHAACSSLRFTTDRRETYSGVFCTIGAYCAALPTVRRSESPAIWNMPSLNTSRARSAAKGWLTVATAEPR